MEIGKRNQMVKTNLAVLWMRGSRVGSVDQSKLEEIQFEFIVNLLQIDATGCQHWNVIARKR